MRKEYEQEREVVVRTKIYLLNRKTKGYSCQQGGTGKEGVVVKKMQCTNEIKIKLESVHQSNAFHNVGELL